MVLIVLMLQQFVPRAWFGAGGGLILTAEGKRDLCAILGRRFSLGALSEAF